MAPDVLLSVVGTDSHDSDDRPRLVRISKVDGRWKADTVIDPFPLVRLQPDKSGHILFACKGGYCELASDDIVRWKPVSSLKMMRYKAVTRDDYARDEGFVWRDRFECVWMRSWTGVSYQCPTDKQPVVLPPSIVGLGNPIILEMNDGSVVLPSLNKLAIGRPGHFRVVMLLTT